MSMHLKIWLDTIREARIDVQKWFSKLDFFANNLKPKNEVPEDTQTEIQVLIHSAFECHLDPAIEIVCDWLRV